MTLLFGLVTNSHWLAITSSRISYTCTCHSTRVLFASILILRIEYSVLSFVFCTFWLVRVRTFNHRTSNVCVLRNNGTRYATTLNTELPYIALCILTSFLFISLNNILKYFLKPNHWIYMYIYFFNFFNMV
jgi:hypothetical protein